MNRTVAFSRQSANIFFHLLTQCNLSCKHCYINPAQHGRRILGLTTIRRWLAELARRSPEANLVLLGGEPTLHPKLAQVVRAARSLGYSSVTIDTNGYLFHDILERVTPEEVDYFSFSLDGASAATNDAIRGAGSFEVCTAGALCAKAKGFKTSLIYTVSRINLDELSRMPDLLARLKVDHFFIQVIGLRGQSAACGSRGLELQVLLDAWRKTVPPTAGAAARLGITVTYPKVYLETDDSFECAGRVADNYFIFPNGRVYRCPLCEDYPMHSLQFEAGGLRPTAPINESDLFALDIPEGCVMNRLIQPSNISYDAKGRPRYKIACCLLKERLAAGAEIP
jgi:MoaA/NifB/PqqE/SkfB family radical SAM enzyme